MHGDGRIDLDGDGKFDEVQFLRDAIYQYEQLLAARRTLAAAEGADERRQAAGQALWLSCLLLRALQLMATRGFGQRGDAYMAVDVRPLRHLLRDVEAMRTFMEEEKRVLMGFGMSDGAAMQAITTCITSIQSLPKDPSGFFWRDWNNMYGNVTEEVCSLGGIPGARSKNQVFEVVDFSLENGGAAIIWLANFFAEAGVTIMLGGVAVPVKEASMSLGAVGWREGYKRWMRPKVKSLFRRR